MPIESQGAVPNLDAIYRSVANLQASSIPAAPAASLQALVAGAWNQRTVYFGDSIMSNHGGPGIGAYGQNLYDKGFWVWANAALGGRLQLVRNAGITGDNTAMMLARIETDVVPYASACRFVMFNGGVNDPTGGSGTAQTFAQTKANLLAIITRLRQLFPVVIWHTPTPYAPTATVAAQVSQIADWVMRTAPTIGGVVLCDNYSQAANKTATTGDMVTGYSNDTPQLHPNSLCARAIAAECVTVITPLLTASVQRTPTQANTVANMTAAYATQVLPNPLLATTTGGTVTGSNVTGTAPSDWTVRAGTGGNYSDGTTAVALTVPSRSDGYGNDINLVVTAGANAGTPVIELLTASHHADVSAGQIIQGVFRLSMSGASNVKKIVLYMTITDSNGSTTMTALTNDGSAFSQSNFSDYVFKTTPYTLGSSITALRLRADITGVDKTMAATFKLQGQIDILPT